jgi:MFS family permease
MSLLGTLFRPAQPIPEDCRSNFNHLYGDVAWFGILNGSTLAFTAIYAARLGANLHLLGLLSAAPALVNLVFALPAGRWLEKNAARSPVFWSGFAARIFYAFFIPLPWIFGHNNFGQIWAILLITFVMNIPNTALVIGFNSMFGDVVPNDWRGYVAGVRNSLLAVVTILTTLVCGVVLVRAPFPLGYQIVFALGVIGGAMSSYHLWFLRPKKGLLPVIPEFTGDIQLAGLEDAEAVSVVSSAAPRRRSAFHRAIQNLSLRTDVLSGSFGRILGLLFFFHLAQYLAIPLFSIYMVDTLHFTDQAISFGTAIYNVSLFIGSTQLAMLSSRLGNRKVIGYGILLISAYPVMMALSHGPTLYILANLMSGMAWAFIGGALFNYLLDMAPAHDRPAHMAWYNLAFNAAILVGSLGGPLIAGSVTIVVALFIFAFLRLLSGLAILRWG